MKLSLNWIQDYIDISHIPVEELVHRLTLSTCEVEEHYTVYEHLDNVRAALIVERRPHPGADRLSVCTVDDGTAKLQIVCGASNARENTIVPLAGVGTLLPREEGETLEIKKSAIRGVESSGMLCSAGELQLEKLTGETNGLLILEDLATEGVSDAKRPGSSSNVHGGDTKGHGGKKGSGHGHGHTHGSIKPGTPLSRLFPLRDTILDIDNKSITHRPDLWSHYGFAREIAALFRLKIKYDPLKEAPHPKAKPGLPEKKIKIDPDAAHAYFGLFCSGVRVTESPLWMRSRLLNIGQRPINNIVDASNYVLFEAGQPNHAFDAKQLKSDTIHVALNGSSVKIQEFTTLDGVSRPLPDGSILIMDGDGKSAHPVALGGVMGGLESGIQDTTEELFLESATFPRERIRRTLSATQLRTDSAVRFEKGQDPAKAKPALHRIVELLHETCPDIATGKITGEVHEEHRQNKIEISLATIHGRLGFPMPVSDVTDILERLHFQIKTKEHIKQKEQAKAGAHGTELHFQITVPSHRSWYDITIPEDIIEELGRIHGYDNIKPEPPLAAVGTLEPNRERRFERWSKNHLIRSGHFTETFNYSFASVEENRLFGADGLKLRNPGVMDRDRLRLSQIPGLVRQAAANQDRYGDVRLFELGRVYRPAGGSLSHGTPRDSASASSAAEDTLSREERRLSLIRIPEASAGKSREAALEHLFAAFLGFRGILERYLTDSLGSLFQTRLLDSREVSPLHAVPFLHPGCAVEFTDETGMRLGVAGILHPAMEEHYDLKRGAVVADLYFDRIFGLADEDRHRADYTPPSIFPMSRFELSVIMDRAGSTADPVAAIRELKIQEIDSVQLLTIYQGAPLPEGKMSVSYEVRCMKSGGTLSGEELQSILERVIQRLGEKGYPLR